MSYERYRDLCISACGKAVASKAAINAIGDAAHYAACADAIRALPLPEVGQSQEPVAWIPCQSNLIEVFRNEKEAKRYASFHGVDLMPVFSLSPDVEAIHKENEQLRQFLKNFNQIMSGGRDQTSLNALVAEADKLLRGNAE